ncbi:MAG: permease-like cell division protein FtsX [Pseudomonadota bacterium]
MAVSQRGRGAVTARTDVAGRLRAWGRNHLEVAGKSLRELLATWISSLMTWLVIGVALALPAIFFLLLANVSDISADWQGKPRVSVYLAHSAPASESRALVEQLRTNATVDSVRFISADEALQEFQARSGFGDVVRVLDENPLPAVIEIVPGTDTAAIRLMVASLEQNALVDSVSVDIEWIERLYALVALGQRFVMALAVFLGLGVLLSIGNTIRLAIENRRAEIEVVKLVGGTDGFVRRPFLYLGFWYGAGGALTAWVMVQASLLFLAGPVNTLIRSYSGEFAVVGLGLIGSLTLMALGAGLGVLGAALAVRRHLGEIEPE